MDNMAVAVSTGCAHRNRLSGSLLWQLSVLFALAHFVMFSLGFEGGMLVHAGRKVGACVACVLLVIIGGRMIQGAFHSAPVTPNLFVSLKTQLTLAVATSLDALFVGAGMGLTEMPFWQTVLAVTGCVFVTTWGGFYIGHFLNKTFGPKMEIAGGVVLIILGIKVLLDGIGIL